MNTEPGILSVTRRKRPEYHKRKAHKVFPNILEQDFDSNEIHTKWCTDFTCLFLENGEKRYNCSIVDPHDRSVIASITDRHMTADPEVRTIRKAIESQPEIKRVLILHSDQGSQYTSNEFVEYCERMRVTQSMSKAGYPYDNAPMERYFNTLKNDLIHEHSYKTEDELYRSIEEYAYVTYNHARPHSNRGPVYCVKHEAAAYSAEVALQLLGCTPVRASHCVKDAAGTAIRTLVLDAVGWECFPSGTS